ncbi:hypothetical protein [Tautonia rosea]|uniref:hypothetical protein n=1 Tax=Tautonia rosea TaxID=2728037 RepID=UPI0014738679|nr:hypothetical protein [Tautonia rosea]
MKAQADRRRGGAALIALVCLSVIGVVLVGLLRVSKARADQLRLIERGCQADWLVEAGLERAVARITTDPSYNGEIWTIPAESLGRRPATVVLSVQTVAEGEGDSSRVHVRADYPSDGPPDDRVRRSKTFRITHSILNKGTQE